METPAVWICSKLIESFEWKLFLNYLALSNSFGVLFSFKDFRRWRCRITIYVNGKCLSLIVSTVLFTQRLLFKSAICEKNIENESGSKGHWMKCWINSENSCWKTKVSKRFCWSTILFLIVFRKLTWSLNFSNLLRVWKIAAAKRKRLSGSCIIQYTDGSFWNVCVLLLVATIHDWLELLNGKLFTDREIESEISLAYWHVTLIACSSLVYKFMDKMTNFLVFTSSQRINK